MRPICSAAAPARLPASGISWGLVVRNRVCAGLALLALTAGDAAAVGWAGLCLSLLSRCSPCLFTRPVSVNQQCPVDGGRGIRWIGWWCRISRCGLVYRHGAGEPGPGAPDRCFIRTGSPGRCADDEPETGGGCRGARSWRWSPSMVAPRRSARWWTASPSCCFPVAGLPVCNELTPALKSAGQAKSDWLRVVLASDGDEQDHRGYIERKGLQQFPYVVSELLGKTCRVARIALRRADRRAGRNCIYGHYQFRSTWTACLKPRSARWLPSRTT